MKNKRTSIIVFGVSFLVFMVIALWGKFFLSDGDEMGFVVLNFYIIMPVLSLIIGFILGFKDLPYKLLYPIVFGLLGIIIPAFIFKGSWDWISLLFSLVPALVGLGIGSLVNKVQVNKVEVKKVI